MNTNPKYTEKLKFHQILFTMFVVCLFIVIVYLEAALDYIMGKIRTMLVSREAKKIVKEYSLDKRPLDEYSKK